MGEVLVVSSYVDGGEGVEVGFGGGVEEGGEVVVGAEGVGEVGVWRGLWGFSGGSFWFGGVEKRTFYLGL